MKASIALSEASALKDRLSKIVRLVDPEKKEKSVVDPYDSACPFIAEEAIQEAEKIVDKNKTRSSQA